MCRCVAVVAMAAFAVTEDDRMAEESKCSSSSEEWEREPSVITES